MSFEKDINILIAERNAIQKEIDRKENELEKCISERSAAENARIILQTAAKKTQKNLEQHLSEIVTNAFQYVFDDPYTFSPDFVERRNKTECDLWFTKGNKKKLRPRFAAGGGVIDIASFALRLAYWRLEKSAPIFILDEPFKMLSKKHIPKAVALLNTLAEEFDLQMIINTHIPEITDQADRMFEIKGGQVQWTTTAKKSRKRRTRLRES
jgi:predicted ATPase